MKSERIPFDAACFTAVTRELQGWQGSEIQNCWFVSATQINLELSLNHKIAVMAIEVQPSFPWFGFITRRHEKTRELSELQKTLIRRLKGQRLHSVEQIANDRIAKFTFESNEFAMIELMGKHSNFVQSDANGRIVAALKTVPLAQSKRPIFIGGEYRLPPVLGSGDGGSPFFHRHFPDVVLSNRQLDPHLYPDHGAYPLALPEADFGKGVAKSSFSVALEIWHELHEEKFKLERLRSEIGRQVSRFLASKMTLVAELESTLSKYLNSQQDVEFGNLLISHQPVITSNVVHLIGYSGETMAIPVKPELDWKANSKVWFDRAKRGKRGVPIVTERLDQAKKDAAFLRQVQMEIEGSPRADLRRLREDLQSRRFWVQAHAPSASVPVEKPFDGHKIRELDGPFNFRVLYGENAEANHYLTTRIARPSDLWLHVRAHQSAHVVIKTQNEPDRVPPETILFAAKIAIQHSKMKHSEVIPVDVVQKRYVSGAKGAKAGSFLYTHERTISVRMEPNG